MKSHIQKYERTLTNDFKFSILLPTWNNLPYLKLCINSLQRHSHYKHQIIVLVNEGNDGTMDWLRTLPDIDIVHATENIGICFGLNACRSMVKADYMLYANDDMYFLPNWDIAINEEIMRIDSPYFMLSATMIEPSGNNPCCVIADFGDSVENFCESDLLLACSSLTRENWSGSTWPPNVVHKDLWDLIGGMSIEFSPGMYSDPDFSRKLWSAGVRHFQGMGKSLVYHFGKKSTRKLRKNRGRAIFLTKWKMSAHFFMSHFLHIGQTPQLPLSEPKVTIGQKIKMRVKVLLTIISNR